MAGRYRRGFSFRPSGELGVQLSWILTEVPKLRSLTNGMQAINSWWLWVTLSLPLTTAEAQVMVVHGEGSATMISEEGT